jgi:hypothetical protein
MNKDLKVCVMNENLKPFFAMVKISLEGSPNQWAFLKNNSLLL